MQAISGSPLLPLSIGFFFLTIAAYYELNTYRVPNKLTISSLGLALLASIVLPQIANSSAGGFESALVGMFVGGIVLLPLYAMGGLGAGCVKAQAAFGAWAGCGLGALDCVKVVGLSSIVALAIAAAVWAFMRRSSQIEAESDDKIATVFHGQVPLSLGTLLGVIVATMVMSIG